ncbi:MAG TPA: MerR family transcriptional regulator [Firmicutes bacterium]|nr:MerR family transcriptional regulator [Bacillota bacterium]
MEYTIKEMAEQLGLPPHVLRYYEKEGLLPQVQRAPNGFRLYSEQDMEWLRFICVLRDTGMPIAEIKDFAKRRTEGHSAHAAQYRILQAHIQKVQDDIQRLQQGVQALEKSLSVLERFREQEEETFKEKQEETEQILRAHAIRYPAMQPQDAVKILYQNVFGGGHMIAHPSASLRRLMEEYQNVIPDAHTPLTEPIGNGICRLHMQALQEKTQLLTVNRLFVASAEEIHGETADFLKKLEILRQETENGRMPFSPEILEEYLTLYLREGCHAVSHSPVYRETYHPAYRLLLEKYIPLLPLFADIENLLMEKGYAVLAVDGPCGSGKTSFASLLSRVYETTVLHMDDFFLPPSLRTEARLAEPGGNIHYERFLQEAAPGIREHRSVPYRVFDCSCMDYCGTKYTQPNPVVLIEGSYSQHPLFTDLFDRKIFITCPQTEQLKRILHRNGPEMAVQFQEKWIPMEEKYFRAFQIRLHSDWILDSSVIPGSFVPREKADDPVANPSIQH